MERAASKTWLWVSPVLVLLAMQIKWWWEPGDDASSYLSIARHMSQGELKLFGDSNVRWAPGYAALLAPAFWISDRPLLLISLIQFALMLALTLGVYRWFRRVTPSVAAPLTVLVMVNVSLWQLYRMTLSEVAFMVWIFWAADVLERVRGSARAREAFAWSDAGGFGDHCRRIHASDFCLSRRRLRYRGRRTRPQG